MVSLLHERLHEASGLVAQAFEPDRPVRLELVHFLAENMHVRAYARLLTQAGGEVVSAGDY